MNRTLRTVLVGGVAAGLATTLSIASPAGATALSSGQLKLSTDITGGGSCTFSTAPTDVTATFADGDAMTKSYTFAQTATGADPGDVLRFTGSMKQTLRSSASNGDLTAISLSGTATSAITSDMGSSSTCLSGGVRNLVTAEAQATLHRSRSSWVHVTVTASGTGSREAGTLFISQESVAGAYVVVVGPRDQSQNQWAYLPAGDYQLQLVSGAASTYTSGQRTASVTTSTKLTFVAAGTAKAPTSGKARTLVKPAGKLTCSTGKATVALTKGVKGATSVALYVNGKKKVTVRHPHGARNVTLSGVPKTKDVTLKAVVKKAGRSLTASRSYRSC